MSDGKVEEFSAQYFLSNLSHEIRTPLNGIVGYTQLLQKTRLDKIQKEYINSMNNCCHQLVQLVNDVLDFSKICTGKVNINKECFSINDIIEEVKSATYFSLLERKQKINYIIDDNIPKFLISDSQKISQILINLISNANKFSEIESRIIVNFNLENSNTIIVIVEDEGIGIDKENQKKIFEPFVQIPDNLTKVGCGLGLAICKKLSLILGGDIDVESEVGKGSIFSFTFNFESHQDYNKIISSNIEILKDKYILIVDDNIDNRVLISELLFEYGLNPIICSSAREALKFITFKRYNFSLALVDICMPEISGIELSTKIKESCDFPIIALSSIDKLYDNKLYDNKLYDNTIFEIVLQKPINNVKLIDTIIKVLNKRDISQFSLNNIQKENKYIIENNKIENKILIAEDISYNSDILVKMLNSLGYYKIDIVSDGEECISKLENQKYNLLLLDLKMPKKNGFDVANYINEKNIKIDIVVVSASVLEKDKMKCRELGIKYFLLKPFNMQHLKSIMTILV